LFGVNRELMRILFIKQLFDPEPTAKSLDFAIELKKRGHEIQVLTGFPSYPLGRIYDGYKQRLWLKEEMNGIEIIRVPIYPNHTKSGFKRSIYYMSYALSASLIGLFLIKKPDVAFVYQGAIPVAVPAILLKWFKKVPFVYDINDLWPETVEDSGMVKNKRILSLINSWANFNYRKARSITVLSPGFKERLIGKGVPEDKITFVNNWNRDIISGHTFENYIIFPKDKLNILYAGTLGPMQSLVTVLLAAEKLQSSKKFNFVFIGTGNDENNLKKITKHKNLDNVTFLPRVSKEKISNYINAADVLLIHLKKTSLFEITIPSKIFSYMLHAKPVLMGLLGDSAEIITKSKCGILFDPENVASLVDAINRIGKLTMKERNEMGIRGKEYYNEQFSIEKATDKMEEVFKQSIN